MKNKAITSRDVDFAKWYTDIVKVANLASYSNVKGFVVIEPNGYAIWEMIQKNMDAMFKKCGHVNVSLPLLIPENLMRKETELIQGFAPEVAWVTAGGEKELEERLCIRPTSETLFSDYYSQVVRSYRDLPKLYNQWCSVIRWEKETRPFLRTREFLWQEGHTIHESAKEAEEETMRMLGIYKEFIECYLAIPVVTGFKTEKEKFAGAEYTTTVEALMYNGIALQSATSHYFGQKFAKAYDITFSNRENVLEHVYQTSWGASTRLIGGLIMVHSDDNGLVLPPRIAPRQVAIIPIGSEEAVVQLANKYLEDLSVSGVTAFIDDSDRSPGFKFAESEVNGIPLRIEIGMRDLEKGEITIARRDTREKQTFSKDIDIVKAAKELMELMQKDMYERAKAREVSKTHTAKTLEDMEAIMNKEPGYIKAMWCGSEECEARIKEIKGLKARCIPFEQEKISDKCVCCGKEAKDLVIWAIQY